MIKIRPIKDKKIWEDFILSLAESSFLQSWNWGEFNKNLGNQIFRLGLYQDNKLNGACLLIKKIAKRGTYFECPGGPLIDWSNNQLFKELINLFKNLGKKNNCSFIRVRPQLQDSLTAKILFKNGGFITAPMHLHAETTWLLNLNKSEEQLLREMRKNTRYLIKKGLKMGITIKQTNEPSDVDLLYKLQMETVSRHRFVPFSKEYFKQEFKAFIGDNQIKIFKAIYKNQVLAIAFIIFYGKKAYYHYSGSSSRWHNIPASYVLQWQVIKEAKKRGCLIYDLWGVSPAEKVKHRFAGVSLFKKGFGGSGYNYLHAHDLPLNSKYWLVYIFEILRKTYRRL